MLHPVDAAVEGRKVLHPFPHVNCPDAARQGDGAFDALLRLGQIAAIPKGDAIRVYLLLKLALAHDRCFAVIAQAGARFVG